MKKFKRITLCFVTAVMTILLMAVAVYADAVFEIEAPESCGTGDTIQVKVVLRADEVLQDSDVFLVYDKTYFELVDAGEGEHDMSAGTVRFRGEFTEDSSGEEWTAKFKALKSGSAVFSISDKWVQNTYNGVVDSTAEDCTINIAYNEGGSSDNVTASDTMIQADISFSLHLLQPESVPSCFSETTAYFYGAECRAWTLNSKMQEDVDYTSDLEDFYALYGYTENENDAAWYLYDTKEGTFQRLLMLQDVKVKATKEPEAPAETSGNSSIFEKLTGLMIGVFVVLVIIIIVFNVVYSRMEKKSRMKKMEERRKASRDALMKKRQDERNAAMRVQTETRPGKSTENESQNMQRPE